MEYRFEAAEIVNCKIPLENFCVKKEKSYSQRKDLYFIDEFWTDREWKVLIKGKDIEMSD